MAVSTTTRLLHGLRESKRGALGCLIVLTVAAVAIATPWLSPHDPLKQDLELRLKSPGFEEAHGTHWLGTDHLGRDIASRIIHGSRVSLIISVSAVVISASLGIAVGLVAGYFRGRIDAVLMGLADIQLAFPFILLIIAIVAVVGPGTGNLIVALGITGWVIHARIVRSEVLSLREREFITAARAIGCGHLKIAFVHLLPNVAPSCIVIATLELARMVMVESGLSFLGLGIQPPTPSWGGALAEGRTYLFTAWWLATFPGMALMMTILGVNLMGDWLRDYLPG